MSINILESKLHIYDENIPDKKYEIGNSLVEFIKCDFSKLKKFLRKKIPENITYKNYFGNLFEIDFNSIYFKTLKNTLINFYNNFDDSDAPSYNGSRAIPFPDSIISEPYSFKHEVYRFFSPLFENQKKIKEILLCLASSDYYNKIEKLSLLYKAKPNLFDFKNTNINSIFYEYDYLFTEPLILINDDGIIIKKHFSDVESLLLLELGRLLYSDTKIIFCPGCKEIYVAKDKRQKYCSNKCKNDVNSKNKNNNIFYELYRKRYRTLHSNYSVKKTNSSDTVLPKRIKIELSSLLTQYTNKDENNSEIIKEYKEKLRAIK